MLHFALCALWQRLCELWHEVLPFYNIKMIIYTYIHMYPINRIKCETKWRKESSNLYNIIWGLIIWVTKLNCIIIGKCQFQFILFSLYCSFYVKYIASLSEYLFHSKRNNRSLSKQNSIMSRYCILEQIEMPRAKTFDTFSSVDKRQLLEHT